MKYQLPLFVLGLTLAGHITFAAKDADVKPALAQPGRSTFEAKQTNGGLEGSWTVAKGDWTVQEGSIVGKEKASDNHPAVLFLKLPGKDSIIRFSYKLDGAQKFELSYNSAKGHLFRVLVGADSLAIAKDKDKKEEASKREDLGKTGATLPAGAWHTMLVEVKGDQVEVQTDDGAKVVGKNDALNVDKTGYRFVIHGESLTLSDVRVWEVAEAAQ